MNNPNPSKKSITLDLTAYLTLSDMLCSADEPERALKVLDLLPAMYRENTPKEIAEMRSLIKSKLITPHGYLSDAHDNHVYVDFETARQQIIGTLRGYLMQAELDLLKNPHIVDVGPGEYWLLQGLLGQFTYKDVALDRNTQSEIKTMPRYKERFKDYKTEVDGERARIFSAMEIIEHLSNPHELAWEAYKHFDGQYPHYIHMSTPEYTYDYHPDWRTDRHGLPHLRAYTPKEFYDAACEIFPGYSWQIYRNPTPGTPYVMSIRGVSNNLSNREPLKIEGI